jgi:carbonic anhydrase
MPSGVLNFHQSADVPPLLSCHFSPIKKYRFFQEMEMKTTKILMSLSTVAVMTLMTGVAQADSSTYQKSPTHYNGHVSAGSTQTLHRKHNDTRWSYNGNSGPDHWSELNEDYKECNVGDQQSPIDLTGAIDAKIEKLNINWHAMPDTVTNNGHSIQINTPKGNFAEIDGDKFELLQFHMHHPSEHTLNGQHFPVELHFVHKSDDGRLGVVGVFIKEGQYNPTFQKILDNMPKSAGTTNSSKGVMVSPAKLLPENAEFYRYEGSLTTPPCSQIVDWAVYDQPIQASTKQINEFAALYPMNARPIQSPDRRYLLKGQ